MLFLRSHMVILFAMIGIVLLAGIGGYILGTHHAPPPQQLGAPQFIPLPAHAKLTRTDTFLLDQARNWYYSVTNASEDDITAYYQAQLPKNGWQCFSAAKSTNMTYYGQTFAGTSVYITAVKGNTVLRMYLGDQDYGSFILGDDLADDAIALKIINEPRTPTNIACS